MTKKEREDLDVGNLIEGSSGNKYTIIYYLGLGLQLPDEAKALQIYRYLVEDKDRHRLPVWSYYNYKLIKRKGNYSLNRLDLVDE